MKLRYTITALLLTFGLMTSCIDDATNRNPNIIDPNDARPEWLLNASIYGSQMDPHIAERIFVLDWMSAGHFQRASGFALGADNNSYTVDYMGTGYLAAWLRDASRAIEVADLMQTDGRLKSFPYAPNVKQMARIWRAELIANATDMLGAMVSSGIGTSDNPQFQKPENVYAFILTELQEAVDELNPNLKGFPENQDLIYQGDVKKWIKLGNSLRMRIAMRISTVDPVLAKTHFEEAAKGNYISAIDDIAKVQEVDAWSPLAGVLGRTWNALVMAKTFQNLTVNLGDVEFTVPAELQYRIKDSKTYLGMRLDKHLPLTTNDPTAGYFYDGIPKYADPRAQKMYSIVGYEDGNNIYPEHIYGKSAIYDPKDDTSFQIELYNKTITDNDTIPAKDKVMLSINIAYSWNTLVAGVWSSTEDSGDKAEMSKNLTVSKNFSLLANYYRKSTNQRVFFGPWESYFLLAEAKLKGWNVAESDEAYYNKGVRASFEYHQISEMADSYLASESYNRVGTSVKYTHTTEPTEFSIGYVDGYTKVAGTTTYKYPKNSIYKNGTVSNDKLTKIITQKFLAQTPWLPLEAWNDHRRLGLPFFENQAVETSYSQNQVPLTPANSTECKWEFYPQRLRYPATWKTETPKDYARAVEVLGGEDTTKTPVWWSGSANQQ